MKRIKKSMQEKTLLREITVKIGLERIDIQKKVTVEMLLDSSVIKLVMSSEFTRKQEFKLKKIKRLIYIRNVDRMFNKERLIENTVEVNIIKDIEKEYHKINYLLICDI